MKAAQAELEKAFAGTETEKALRLSLENKLSEMKKMHEGDLDMALVLEEKDRSGSCPCDRYPDSHLSGSPFPTPFLLVPHSKETRNVRTGREVVDRNSCWNLLLRH